MNVGVQVVIAVKTEEISL